MSLERGFTCVSRLVMLTGLLVLMMGNAPMPKVKTSGTFTNLRWHEEAGDILGIEVRIVMGWKTYQATVQLGEGEPSDLVLAKQVLVKGTSIEITFMDPFPNRASRTTMKIQGQIRSDRLVGRIIYSPSGNSETINLPRTKSYWE